MPVYTFHKFYNDDKCRRDGDLPAIEDYTGSKFWYKDGKCYRNGDMPMIECSNGNKSWYKKSYNIITIAIIK